MVVIPTLPLLSGFLIPMIGLGTWRIRNESVDVAIDAAIEAGYRHFDTAYFYENEYEIGTALKRWFDSGKLKREDVFITTKLPHEEGMQLDQVEYFMKESLKNLGLSYVDLYLIHFPVGVKNGTDGNLELATDDHVELWKKMEEQVTAGRAKSIGLSNFNISQIERIRKSAKIKPAVLEVEVHVMFAQRRLVNYAQKNDMVVIGYSPLGSPAYDSYLLEVGLEPKDLPDLLGNRVVRRIARKHKKDPAQILLRFLIQRNVVAIPKSETPSRIKSNIDVFDFSLDSCDMHQLYALEKGEEARVIDWAVPILRESPEWPWIKQLLLNE